MRIYTRIMLCLLLTMAAAPIVPGCATGNKKAYDSERDNVFDAEFDAGKDRKPTAQTLYSMGRMLAARNQDEQAYFVFDRCISEYPTFVPAYNDAAELKMRDDALEEAMAYLERGLEHGPDDPVLINNMGMCHMLRGEHEAALARFDRAHDLAPREQRYSANRATVMGLMGRYDDSLALYRKLMPPSDAHYNVAVLAEARNDDDIARQHFLMAEQLERSR